MPRTLQEIYEGYVAHVFAPDPPARNSAQWVEMRKAFFAGAAVAARPGTDYSHDLNQFSLEVNAEAEEFERKRKGGR